MIPVLKTVTILCGKAKSGKSTLAYRLKNEVTEKCQQLFSDFRNIEVLSLATPVKEIFRELYGFDFNDNKSAENRQRMTDISDVLKDNVELTNNFDKHLHYFKSKKFSDVTENLLCGHPCLFSHLLRESAERQQVQNAIIDDCRYNSEIDYFAKLYKIPLLLVNVTNQGDDSVSHISSEKGLYGQEFDFDVNSRDEEQVRKLVEICVVNVSKGLV